MCEKLGKARAANLPAFHSAPVAPSPPCAPGSLCADREKEPSATFLFCHLADRGPVPPAYCRQASATLCHRNWQYDKRTFRLAAIHRKSTFPFHPFREQSVYIFSMRCPREMLSGSSCRFSHPFMRGRDTHFQYSVC